MRVFPVPEAPYKRIPREGFNPYCVNREELNKGISNKSRIRDNSLLNPPIDAYVILFGLVDFFSFK